jgi:hypothetical protein
MADDGQKANGAPRYYCRACGDALAPGAGGLFHPDCLKADKQRRVREQRQRELEKFRRWLQRQRCPKCGEPMCPQRSSGS